MISRKEAYRILGLKPGANKYEIENRYTVLAKAYRGRTDEAAEEEIRRFTLAYDILTGRYIEPEPEDPRLNEVILGKTRREWRHKWAYAKAPLLVTLIIVAIIAGVVYSIVTKDEPDVTMQAYGAFASGDEEFEKLKSFITNAADYLDEEAANDEDDEALMMSNPGIQVNRFFTGNDGQMNYASSLKIMLVLSGADPTDLVLLDRNIYERYVEQGAFMPLDDFYAYLRETYPEAVERYVTPMRFTLSEDVLPSDMAAEEHIYALDLTDMQPFNALDVYGNAQVLVIPVHNEQPAKAEAIIEKFMAEADQWASEGETLLPTPTISPTPRPEETLPPEEK